MNSINGTQYTSYQRPCLCARLYTGKSETETAKADAGGVGKPEDEDEEAEKREERGDVVHRSQHDEQLMTQRRQEPNELQYPQQPERP